MSVTLPKLPSVGSGDYNSVVQQARRSELVTGGRSGGSVEETPSFVIGALNPGGFESPSSADSHTNTTTTTSITSSSPTAAASSTHARSGSNGSAAVQRSASHQAAVDALDVEAAVNLPLNAQHPVVAALLDETMAAYKDAVAAQKGNSDGSAASGAADAVPNASTSTPAQPTAPKPRPILTEGEAGSLSINTPLPLGSPSNAAAAANAANAAQPPTSSPAAGASGLKFLRVLHASVQQTLGAIQNKTTRILQDQERDLLRSFKIRLLEVSDELEKERKKNESGSIEWVGRCRKLTEELDWVRELTESLSAENKNLLKENRKAMRAASTQEQDRQFLIKQLVNVKKENARLRYMVEQQMRENQSVMAQITAGAQQQVAGMLHSASSTANSFPPPPGTASSALTSYSLAAHDNAGTTTLIPKLKFQSIGGAAGAGPSTAPNRMSSTSTSITPYAAPGNMRASLLAAATTEITSGRSATSTDGYRLATAPAAAPGPGNKAIVSASLLPESRLAAGAEKRFKSVIARLKRSNEESLHKYRTIRSAYLNEINSRTQLQHIFKSCVDAVREQLAAQQRAGTKPNNTSGRHPPPPSQLLPAPGLSFSSSPPFDPRLVPLGELSAEDRLTIVEWYLSQSNVLLFLFDRMFPLQFQPAGYGAHQLALAMANTALTGGGAGAGAGAAVAGQLDANTAAFGNTASGAQIAIFPSGADNLPVGGGGYSGAGSISASTAAFLGVGSTNPNALAGIDSTAGDFLLSDEELFRDLPGVAGAGTTSSLPAVQFSPKQTHLVNKVLPTQQQRAAAHRQNEYKE